MVDDGSRRKCCRPAHRVRGSHQSGAFRRARRSLLTRNLEIETIRQVASWAEFRELEPQLAQQGRELLYFFGVGLGFLATVRADGGPRLHPMCPLLTDDALYAFIVPSPKQRDLVRDGRFAIHSFPLPDNEDAFYVTGHAEAVTDPTTRQRLADQFAGERAHIGAPRPTDEQQLFTFDVSTVLLTRTTGHGDPAPVHHVWRAG